MVQIAKSTNKEEKASGTKKIKKTMKISIVHIAMYFRALLMYVFRLHGLGHGPNASVECLRSNAHCIDVDYFKLDWPD